MYKPKVFKQLNQQFNNSTDQSVDLTRQLEPIINELAQYMSQKDILQKFLSVERVNRMLRLAQSQLAAIQETSIQNELAVEYTPYDLLQPFSQQMETLSETQKQTVVKSIGNLEFKKDHLFNPISFIVQKLKAITR